MGFIATWLLALGLTIAVETAIALWWCPEARTRLRIDAPLLQCATQPLATWLVAGGVLGFWPVEALVIGVEAIAYRTVTGLPARRALGLSLLANGATIALALLLRFAG